LEEMMSIMRLSMIASSKFSCGSAMCIEEKSYQRLHQDSRLVSKCLFAFVIFWITPMDTCHFLKYVIYVSKIDIPVCHDLSAFAGIASN
jgi:hypothetical protein